MNEAIILSLQWVEEVNHIKMVICSDSRAAVHSIDTGQMVLEYLLIEIHVLLMNIQQSGLQHTWV